MVFSQSKHFGKNRQVKVFWPLFIVTAGLMLTQGVDPATAEQIIRMMAMIDP
ncbi:hypothetical protein [Methanoregula sp.]|uniref:hypothetical protein n=1 Tax=Methanoregula sp. TaxID=2052170 RepID=UPI0023699C84|nr:hypothetical protein [Methanoregula sp.]MDD1685345.1 hypothetical protein [Methanoregula sp.]